MKVYFICERGFDRGKAGVLQNALKDAISKEIVQMSIRNVDDYDTASLHLQKRMDRDRLSDVFLGAL